MFINRGLHILCNQLMHSGSWLDEVHPEVLGSMAKNHAIIPASIAIAVAKCRQGLRETISNSIRVQAADEAERIVVNNFGPKQNKRSLDSLVGLYDDLPPSRYAII